MKESYNKNNLVEQPYEYYLKQYRNMNPELISSRLGFPYSEVTGSFQVRFMGNLYNITHPDFQITAQDEGERIYTLKEDVHAQILLLRYITDGDYMEPSRSLSSYRDLPWGEVYYRQFYGRCVVRLARMYGKKQKKFIGIMESLHGIPRAYGDMAYEFEFFHNLFICFILWEGDEEFPPSAQILFSDNFALAFSPEDVAYVIDVVLDYMKEYEKRGG